MFLRENIGLNNEVCNSNSFGSRELVATLVNGLQSDIEMFDYLAELLLGMGVAPVAFMVKHRAGILREGLRHMAEEEA